MALRPILKRSPPASSHRPCLVVHFPPTPSLATHTFALSPTAYDRSPIVVLPNSCALPERGCPGRTYTLEEEAGPSLPKNGSFNSKHTSDCRERHPRAMTSPSREDVGRVGGSTNYSHLTLPALIPDLSSESDESDSFLHTPLESSTVQHDIHGLAIPQTKYQSIDENDDPVTVCAASPPPSALSFLPHPPSPPRTAYDYHSHCDYYEPSSFPFNDESNLPKPKRRRERKFDCARAPDRIPNERGGTPGSPPKGRRGKTAPINACFSGQSGFHVEEESCLGGF